MHQPFNIEVENESELKDLAMRYAALNLAIQGMNCSDVSAVGDLLPLARSIYAFMTGEDTQPNNVVQLSEMNKKGQGVE